MLLPDCCSLTWFLPVPLCCSSALPSSPTTLAHLASTLWALWGQGCLSTAPETPCSEGLSQRLVISGTDYHGNDIKWYPTITSMQNQEFTGKVWFSVCHSESRCGSGGAETAPGILEAVLKRTWCIVFTKEKKASLAVGNKQPSVGMLKAVMLKNIKLKVFLNDAVIWESQAITYCSTAMVSSTRVTSLDHHLYQHGATRNTLPCGTHSPPEDQDRTRR